MIFATIKDGPNRDGSLLVVSRDRARCLDMSVNAAFSHMSLRQACEGWSRISVLLSRYAAGLEKEGVAGGIALPKPIVLTAPLPRAFQFLDGSAYLRHMELVRQARGAPMPESFKTDPLMYQGLSDRFFGPREDFPIADEAWGIDCEGELAVVVTDVPMGVTADEVEKGGSIILVMLLNDWSLRNLIPPELAKNFGFVHGKPPSSFAPFAVTPDELGTAWDGRRVHLTMKVWVNGKQIGALETGDDMDFGFSELVAHAAKTRRLPAGTIIGSGTISNRSERGVACLAELRMKEVIADKESGGKGTPTTPFLSFGDIVRMEAFDRNGVSVFGAIEQKVVPYQKPPPGEYR